MRRTFMTFPAALLVTLAFATFGMAHAPSGAIFTTVADGTEVNFNHYAAKQDVYLDGGPGPGAPQTAAGLDDGTYVFQVTDPSGKVLLSSDAARCRQFTVADGVINGVVATGCQHVTGLDVDHGATTVQLYPYDNTPNNGGVYKAWVTFREDFLAGCAALGQPNGLNVVDCGRAAGNQHGFVPAHSKTDNFKVKSLRLLREIDTVFFNDANGNNTYEWWEERIPNLAIIWTDTLGVSNTKFSDPNVSFEAHVEAPEAGVHQISIFNQPGCAVGAITLDGVNQGTGPRVVSVTVTWSSNDKEMTNYIFVACSVGP
jgi:hypothetical protein